MKEKQIIRSSFDNTSENQKTKPCPYCAEQMNSQAKICRLCHMNLETGMSVAPADTDGQQKSFTVGDGVRFGCGSIIITVIALILMYVIVMTAIFG